MNKKEMEDVKRVRLILDTFTWPANREPILLYHRKPQFVPLDEQKFFSYILSESNTNKLD